MSRLSASARCSRSGSRGAMPSIARRCATAPAGRARHCRRAAAPHGGPHDMRMGQDGTSAADLVSGLEEGDLAELIRNLGEERYARRVARAIVAARRRAPIRRTGELAEIVRAAIPRREPGLDAATRTFQALRIAVNDELGELDRGLAAAERLLMPGGRLAVVAFHSLEDARVKSFLRHRSGRAAGGSRHLPPATATMAPSFTLLTRRPIRPRADEIARKPRARAARFRP